MYESHGHDDHSDADGSSQRGSNRIAGELLTRGGMTPYAFRDSASSASSGPPPADWQSYLKALGSSAGTDGGFSMMSTSTIRPDPERASFGSARLSDVEQFLPDMRLSEEERATAQAASHARNQAPFAASAGRSRGAPMHGTPSSSSGSGHTDASYSSGVGSFCSEELVPRSGAKREGGRYGQRRTASPQRTAPTQRVARYVPEPSMGDEAKRAADGSCMPSMARRIQPRQQCAKPRSGDSSSVSPTRGIFPAAAEQKAAGPASRGGRGGHQEQLVERIRASAARLLHIRLMGRVHYDIAMGLSQHQSYVTLTMLDEALAEWENKHDNTLFLAMVPNRSPLRGRR